MSGCGCDSNGCGSEEEAGCGCGCGGCQPEGDYQVFAGLDHVPAFKVVGVSAVISGPKKAADEINALWEEFFSQQVGSKLKVNEQDPIMAVYSDYEGDHTKPYRLTIGYEIAEDAEVPTGMHGVDIKEDDYALMRAGGEQPKVLMDTWRTIWQSDLDRHFGTDFEVYGPRFF